MTYMALTKIVPHLNFVSKIEMRPLLELLQTTWRIQKRITGVIFV